MSDIAIRVENLSKQFRIGMRKYSYYTLRDHLADSMKSILRRGRSSQPGNNTIWALQDVSFEVKRGEVIGFIGRNGAGKSTLLKILSRITEPTSGRAEIYGRVGSLLEVGTGFHPELTGRDNIYLNGAILGMKKTEIDRRFDEIVAFSEVEKFIDTPVKHYSSGMYVRLAFAVAAHLEPEILIIDEVLAVGDAAFQRKCMAKMGDVGKEGRTVLFVSHNMAAIANICQKTVLLHQGTLLLNGETKMVIDRYLTDVSKIANTQLCDRKDRKGTGEIKVVAIEFLDHKGIMTQHPISGQQLTIRMSYKSFANKVFKNCRASVTVTRNEQVYFNLSTELVDTKQLDLSGEGHIDFVLPELPLSQSSYIVHTYIEVNKEIQDWVTGAAEMSVIDGDFYGTGRNYPIGWQAGTGLLVRYGWRHTNQN